MSPPKTEAAFGPKGPPETPLSVA